MLGHLGTSGADYMDYILADRTLIPPELSDFYSEKVSPTYTSVHL
jgi:predicted O-linked N-acetylglucosamine transferase (SPINDLY family)